MLLRYITWITRISQNLASPFECKLHTIRRSSGIRSGRITNGWNATTEHRSAHAVQAVVVFRTTVASKPARDVCSSFPTSCKCQRVSPSRTLHVGSNDNCTLLSQHRVSPFRLADPTKPGHRRFIALWLVDPHNRILSAANVTPQRQDWWLDSAFGGSTESRKAVAEKLPAELLQLLRAEDIILDTEAMKAKGTKLPPSVMEMIRSHFSLGTLSLEEARENRLVLMEERTSHQREAEEEWMGAEYSFCEH